MPGAIFEKFFQFFFGSLRTRLIGGAEHSPRRSGVNLVSTLESRQASVQCGVARSDWKANSAVSEEL